MQTKFKAILLAMTLLVSSGSALADDNFWLWLVNFSRQKEVKPVDKWFKVYSDECGSCHYAYPPGLLPSKSWEKLLNEKALSEHFGKNATLDKDTLKAIHDYAIRMLPTSPTTSVRARSRWQQRVVTRLCVSPR